jgi:peptidoglycan/LPS O-acetylase OafA/YrhL
MGTQHRNAVRWFSPFVGGVAPALFLFLRAAADSDGTSDFGTAASAFVIWSLRDLLVAYVLALPVVHLLLRVGVRRAALLWLAVAALGAPVGYILAHPLVYAWTPTDKDVRHGPYWGLMLGHMALFGLTGPTYRALSKNGKVAAEA